MHQMKLRTFQGSKIDVEQLANIKKLLVKIVRSVVNQHCDTELTNIS